jgi:hypothetical protein
MFRTTPGNFTEIAGRLLDTKRWQSHGQMISWRDASSIGLAVTYVAPESDEWQAYWRLYCQQRLAVKNGEKLFESDSASLQIEDP